MNLIDRWNAWRANLAAERTANAEIVRFTDSGLECVKRGRPSFVAWSAIERVVAVAASEGEPLMLLVFVPRDVVLVADDAPAFAPLGAALARSLPGASPPERWHAELAAGAPEVDVYPRPQAVP